MRAVRNPGAATLARDLKSSQSREKSAVQLTAAKCSNAEDLCTGDVAPFFGAGIDCFATRHVVVSVDAGYRYGTFSLDSEYWKVGAVVGYRF